MGNHNSVAERIHFDPKDWDEVERSTLYEVLRNRKTQQLGNRYHFNIKEHRQLDDQIELYDKRRNSSNWVQVIGANLEKGGFGFCGSQESAHVITERIPTLLSQIPRLNRQDSLVVLYNALRGYSDISRLIVPGLLTDKMIGFTSQGQTKVWINENFGMNYPNHYIPDAKINESDVISNLLTAISSRLDVDPQLLNGIRSAGSFNTAIGFIRSRGGVPDNILEANTISTGSYFTKGQTSVLNPNAPIQSVVQPTLQQPVQQSTFQPAYNVPTSYQTGYQPWVPPTTTTTSTFNQGGYRIPSGQYGQTPGYTPTSNYVATSGFQPSNIGYQPATRV